MSVTILRNKTTGSLVTTVCPTGSYRETCRYVRMYVTRTDESSFYNPRLPWAFKTLSIGGWSGHAWIAAQLHVSTLMVFDDLLQFPRSTSTPNAVLRLISSLKRLNFGIFDRDFRVKRLKVFLGKRSMKEMCKTTIEI